MKQEKLTPEFVEFIPENLKEGVLYISLEFETAVHLCACGCKKETVTPFSRPDDWKLTVEERNVSLHPSIGNWQFPCRSHYWIKNNQVVLA
jgi:hypothetical protein